MITIRCPRQTPHGSRGQNFRHGRPGAELGNRGRGRGSSSPSGRSRVLASGNTDWKDSVSTGCRSGTSGKSRPCSYSVHCRPHGLWFLNTWPLLGNGWCSRARDQAVPRKCSEPSARKTWSGSRSHNGTVTTEKRSEACLWELMHLVRLPTDPLRSLGVSDNPLWQAENKMKKPQSTHCWQQPTAQPSGGRFLQERQRGPRAARSNWELRLDGQGQHCCCCC